MSLIVARKYGKQLALVSDTKLTYENYVLESEKTNPLEGVIKIVIVNPNLCIAYAGVIKNAENALKEIQPNHAFDEALEILNKHHQQSKLKTDFLICAGLPHPKIYKIKGNESKEVQTAWIGDLDAFNRFQESIMGTKRKKIEKKISNTTPNSNVVISEINLCAETNMQVDLFAKMSSAIDEVIEDDNIDSVGGFKVNVVFEDSFNYTKYVKLYRGEIEFFGTGDQVIVHGSASEGAYSVNFLGGSNDFKTVGLHIRQGNFGIVYNKKSGGLLDPQIVKSDEVDFIDHVKKHFGLIAVLSTQDRVNKFIVEGRQAFDKQDFKSAIDKFDKANESTEGKKNAEILFYKGICLLNINEFQAASKIFQDVVNIDSSYQQKINQLFIGKR